MSRTSMGKQVAGLVDWFALLLAVAGLGALASVAAWLVWLRAGFHGAPLALNVSVWQLNPAALS